MSGQQTTGIDRRSFMKAAGTVAGASLLGVGTAASATSSGFDGTFANWRVREARKVWDRGYRGRPDRTIALTDSGIDARHPDLGPWNGVQATTNDGELVLTGPDLGQRSRAELDGETVTRSGTAGPGTFATGSEVPTEPFQPPAAADELDAVLSWTPTEPANDLELRLDIEVGEDEWEEVATAATANETEELVGVQIEPDETYRFVAEQYATVSCTFEIVGTFFEYEGNLETYDDSEVFAFLDEETAGPQPKTVGWFNETARYGDRDHPNDPDGHGSHCSSIMGGSGRASSVDTVTEDEPRAVLTAGDTLEYQIDADAGTGVYISAYGDGIELLVQGPDGRELDSSEVGIGDTSVHENNVAEAPAEQTGTYTLYVRAAGGELASTGRCERVAYGCFHAPDATDGDRSDGEPALHSGMAPDASLVGLQGLSDPTESLGEYAEEFSRIFNMRAVNMSWGYVGGLPLGAFGGVLGDIPASIKQIAEGGILTVAAAGNAATPANGNGAPGIADECISVAATDHSDGLVSYSSGGVGGVDEDDGGEYMKPDVTAPGGSLTDLVNAALAAAPDADPEEVPIRDYTGKAGTSMASPYTTGTAGLVSEAMEFAAPSQIALPTPEETGIEDVLRLKQVLLATASETAFTAAPFHRAHAPTYQHGGRDPYEGFGRINPDAAVDAVTRTLVDGTGLAAEETAGFSELSRVGLNLPEDSRAVAGHVVAPDGTIDAEIAFSHYSGGNEGMTKGDPHLDLFVYDAESPAINGEPNVVASAQGTQGSGAVSVDVSAEDSDVYYVVAKIVNVPGVVNGYDVQANFELSVDYTAAKLPALSATGSRADDGSAFTAGQSNQVDVTVSTISSEVPDDATVAITDQVPAAWTVDDEYGDVVNRTGTEVDLGTATAAEIRDGGVTRTYFAEAPDESGEYVFGEASLELVDGEVEGLRGTEAAFGGTDTNYVGGVDQNTV